MMDLRCVVLLNVVLCAEHAVRRANVTRSVISHAAGCCLVMISRVDTMISQNQIQQLHESGMGGSRALSRPWSGVTDLQVTILYSRRG